MKELIFRVLKAAGASDVGVCRARIYSELKSALKNSSGNFSETDINKRINPFLIMPYAKSVIVFAVSYKSNVKGNISSYAYGKDYHTVLREIAGKGIDILNKNGYRGRDFADTGELCDRHLAYLAGLGFFGKNHCLIHPRFGSFIFLGYILTDCELLPDKPLKMSCKGCNKCIKSCPANALLTNDFNKCLSFVTQKKGELLAEEKALMKKTNTMWGCDICQRVCPHNISAPNADIKAFSENLITELSVPEEITNKEFKKRYGDRAFSWRGKGVLVRNETILKE